MQSWLVTIRVTDDGIEDENIQNYMTENEIKEEILRGNNCFNAGIELTDIIGIAKEK